MSSLIQVVAYTLDVMRLAEAAITNLNRSKDLAQVRAKLEKALQKAWRKEEQEFLERLETLRGFFPPEEVKEAIIPPWYDWGMILAFLAEAQELTFLLFASPINEAVQRSLGLGIWREVQNLGISGAFDIAAQPEAMEYLRDYGARLVTNIDETTREYIRTQVSHAMDEGWSYNRTAKAISERYEQFRIGKPQQHIQSRAHLVAVTETGNAYEEGRMSTAQYLKSQGLEMEHYWSNVGDDRVSDGCLANTAVGWIPLDQPFPSGHMRPLRFPGCRCTQLTRVKPD